MFDIKWYKEGEIMAKMHKPQVRQHCYYVINNFINSSKNHEPKCDVVVATNDNVMILWNVPVIFHELTFKNDENYFRFSVCWGESENRTGDLIADQELPDMFDSRFIALTSYGDSQTIDFSNSWRTMIRCSFLPHHHANTEKVLSIANEYKNSK